MCCGTCKCKNFNKRKGLPGTWPQSNHHFSKKSRQPMYIVYMYTGELPPSPDTASLSLCLYASSSSYTVRCRCTCSLGNLARSPCSFLALLVVSLALPYALQVRLFSGKPGHKPLGVLRHHTAEVTSVAWAPGPHHDPADQWAPQVGLGGDKATHSVCYELQCYDAIHDEAGGASGQSGCRVSPKP